MHSYHNFMFPFRFDKTIGEVEDRHEFYKKNAFDERVIDNLNKKFQSSLKKDAWTYEKFSVNDHLDYNEMVYFYDFVKDTLFNKSESVDTGATSYYFKKKIEKDAKYIIKIKDKESYTLKLTGINLRIFDTGVGILSFEIENNDYSAIDDILMINEFGRRIYPQYVSEGFSLGDTYGSFLAEYLEVNGIKEKFDTEYKSEDIKLASFILKTLGDAFTAQKNKEKKFLIQPILDDRMFVLCWYGNDEFSNVVKEDYEKSDNWYKFAFIDGSSKMVQDGAMQKELIQKSTYTRWKEDGTFYGITRYSFVCLTKKDDFGTDIISNHIKTMYYQMTILLLATRASILRFSDEITAISDIPIKANSEIVDKTSSLYRNYIRFTNKLYFKEITPQEQGIELYDKAREVMRIDADVLDISNEIKNLYSYSFMLEEKSEKEQMNQLTKLGTVFLPPTLLAGIFGANIFDFNLSKESLLIGLLAMFLVSIIGYLSISRKPLIKFISGVSMIMIMIGSVLCVSKTPIFDKCETLKSKILIEEKK